MVFRTLGETRYLSPVALTKGDRWRVPADTEARRPLAWRNDSRSVCREQRASGTVAMLVAGPSERHPQASQRMEFLRLAG